MTAISAPGEGRLDALRDRVVDQQPRKVGGILFGVIAAFAVLGALDRAGMMPGGIFDLDGEAKPPALASALLLAGGGAVAALVWTVRRERRWLALAAFLAFMGVDEALTLHEILQDRTNRDWQQLYLPVVAVGGVAWLLVYSRLRDRERLLFALGAAAWLVAQIDEKFQSNPSDGRVEGYGTLATIEETLELAGSALFVLALLLALRRLSASAERRSPRSLD